MQQRLSQVKEDVINKIIVMTAVLFVFPYMLSLARWFDIGWKNIYVFHTAVYLAIVGLAVYRKRFNYFQKTIAVSTLYLIISFVGLYKFGLNGGHYLAIVAMAIISTLTKRSFAIYASLVIVSIFSLIAIGYSTYTIDPVVDLNVLVRSSFHWLLTIVMIFSVILIFIYGFGDFYKKLVETIEENEKVNSNLLLVKSIIDKSPSLIYSADIEGNIIMANKEFQDVFSLQESEIIGKLRQEIMPVEVAKQHRDNDLEVIRTKKSIVIEEENMEADGKHYYISQKFPLFDSKGAIQSVVGISTDVTEHFRTKEALIESEYKYKSLFENSADGILVLNEQSEILELNNKICEILGYSRDELKVLKGYEFIHSDDLAGKDHDRALAQLLNGDTLITQYRLQKKDGSYIATELSTKMIAEGQFLNIVRDITERKLAENAIKESENKYRSFFENSMDAILLTNMDGQIFSANPAACEMFECSEEEIKKLGRAGITDATDPRLQVIISTRAEKGRVSSEVTLVRKGNNYFEAEISSAIFKNADDTIFASMIIRDISERKKAEKSLQEREKILSVIFNNHTDLQLLVSLQSNGDFNVDTINKPYIDTATLYGITLDLNEIIGKPVSILNDALGLGDEYYDKTIAKYREVAKTGKSLFYIESIVVYGKTYISKVTLSSILNDEGKCQYILYNSHNITEQKKAKNALLESEEKFKQIFLTSPDYVTISKVEDGKYLDINENFIQKSGYTREEIIGKTSRDINIWNNSADLNRMISKLNEFGKVENFEAKFKLKKGNLINGLLSASLLTINDKPHILTITRDITELKHAEQAYMETAANLRSMIDNRNDSIYSIDRDFKYIIFNNTFEKFTNKRYNIEIKKGTSAIENLDLKEAKFWIPKFESVFKGESDSFIFTLETNKETRYFQTTLNPIVEDDIITGASGVSIDITERILIEEALKLSEEKFEKAFRLSPFLITLSTFEGKIVDVNDCVYETLGYTRDEFLARKVNDNPLWVNVEDRENFINLLKRGEHISSKEVLFYKKSGEIRVFSWSGCVIELEGVKTCLTIVYDITERKQAEVALVNEKNLLSAIIENIPVMLTRYDPGTNILYLNKEFEEKTGWKTEDLQTINLMEMVYPDINYREEVLAYMQSASADWKEFVLSSKAGALIDSEWCNLRLADGTQIGIGIDITEEKKNKAEIKNLNSELELKVLQRTAQLEAINKELETFSYSVSHDLKAPLRGIDGYSKLLLDIYKSELNEDAQSFIDKIRKSTLQMNQIIDDLLDYSRLERSQLHIGKIKIKDLIKSVLSVYSKELEAGYFNLDTKIDDLEIIADSKGLIIAFRNLIENAIKFTKAKDKPTIKIEIEETALSWIISVNDNGIGFDMQYHHKIFNIFQRLQRAEDFPGTGIGLALVSKAMQRMHGKTWADSVPNVGSTFYLEIPKNQ